MGCVPYAIQAYIERPDDVNPQVVQMNCREMSHWLYVSDSFIASKFGPEGTDYTGPRDALPEHLEELYQNFLPASRADAWAQEARAADCKSFDDFKVLLKEKRLANK